MHFVDDIDFIARRIRRKHHFVFDLAHVVDARVRRAVYFDNVETRAFRDFRTMRAGAARSRRRPVFAVERFCEDARRRRFAAAARTGKQIRMSDLMRRDRIFQSFRNKFLPDQIGKLLRSPTRRRNFVSHKISVI